MNQRTALISVYNKAGIVEFARQLTDLGFKIIASGGTAKELSTAGIEVTDTATLVGGRATSVATDSGGAILGHRVVTLSREIHAGLLARDTDEDRAELKKLNIPYIDLVCVDLYPLADEIAKWQQPLSLSDALGDSPLARGEEYSLAAKAAILEKTDIGGPTMIRSAAKGRRIVVCNPEDRPKIIEWLKNGQPDKENTINKYCAKAEFVVADYALASARYLSQGNIDGVVAHEVQGLKYGENGWQVPAGLYVGVGDGLKPSPTRDVLSLDKFRLLAGTTPSYNNLADVDRLLQTMTHIAAGFDVNFNQSTAPSLPRQHSASPPEGGKNKVLHAIAVGVKHGNPCGAAVADEPSVAIQKMLEGDLRAIFGGLVMVNFAIDEKLAEIVLSHRMESGRRLLDGIIAPEFTPGAIELMKRKGDKCRFLVNPSLSSLDKNSLDQHRRFRYVRGGFLAQPNYNFVLDLQTADGISNLSDTQKSDIILAWAIGSTSNSNTVTIVKNNQLLGNGVGQQDRVSCCQLAIKRAKDAGHDVKFASAYSDSFFPFVDGVETLFNAGITSIFATSGSVRDDEIKKFCADHKISLVMLPDSQSRGFFGH